MAWFKVDDGLAMHYKTVAAGNAAIGLWVRAGSWSMQSLTDGFIPDAVVSALGSRGQAQKLVEVGLWDRLPTGYAFHDWEDRQPSKDEIVEERAANARRQQAWRDRRRREREAEE